MHRLPIIVVMIALALLFGASTLPAFATVADAPDPTVRVGDATIRPGETATVPIVLSSAPDGLAGYRLSVSVEAGEVVRMEAADYAMSGLNATPEMRDGDTTVVLKAADVNDEIRPGASGITLASITVQGLDSGETSLTVDAHQLDDDDGARISAGTQRGQIVVADRTERNQDRPDATSVSGRSTATMPTVSAQEKSLIGGWGSAVIAFVLVGAILVLLGILVARRQR